MSKPPSIESAAIVSQFQTTARNLAFVSSTSYTNDVGRAIELLISCFSRGGKLLVFGNGGSAADAMHICAELVGKFMSARKALPAIALSANQAILTAWSNDYDFDTVFARQIEGLGNRGDIAWGISTSGKSPNVIEGLKVSRERGLFTIGMTGGFGDQMASWCDVLMGAPVADTPRIQEVHLVTYHVICAAVEAWLVSS